MLRLAKDLAKEDHIASYAKDGPTCTVDDLAKLVGMKFGTIYADPPWQYGNQGTRGATDDHYQTMTVEQIAALPVGDLVADDSHLWLWTTNAFLFECPKIFAAWGFEYKSMMVWIKPQMGIGNYVRVSHELPFLAVRGNAPFADRSQMSWVQADRTEHSVKPECFRKIIEASSPGPRLELLGRRCIDNWTVWGNEIERGMFDADVKEL
jgi:N6-adenosine-specific RNA methylase IME4